MPRSTNNVASKQRRKKYLKAARGYFGARSKLYRTARQAVEKGWGFAYRDRKVKKREFRKLWIIRINAGTRDWSQPFYNIEVFLHFLHHGTLPYWIDSWNVDLDEICMEIIQTRKEPLRKFLFQHRMTESVWERIALQLKPAAIAGIISLFDEMKSVDRNFKAWTLEVEEASQQKNVFSAIHEEHLHRLIIQKAINNEERYT